MCDSRKKTQLELVAVETPKSWNCTMPECDGTVLLKSGDEFFRCKKCHKAHWFREVGLESQREDGKGEPNRVAIFRDLPDNEESRALAVAICEDLGKEHTALRARATSDAKTIVKQANQINAMTSTSSNARCSTA